MTSNYQATKRLFKQVKDIDSAYKQLAIDQTEAINHLINLTFSTDYFEAIEVNGNVENAFASATTSDFVNGVADLEFFLDSTIAMLEDDMA